MTLGAEASFEYKKQELIFTLDFTQFKPCNSKVERVWSYKKMRHRKLLIHRNDEWEIKEVR